ncbi:hypothetical protein BDF21DRAFT_468234 [Thamnidium elegans]|nr:hypothetical protein BDF21DRAFT_468234 [Thamnidium elegans]
MTPPNTEQAVLESPTMPTNWSAAKPKIIEFYDFEGEDFRYFKSVLETFFSLTGITQDHRRVNILRTQLRRSAGVYFDKCLEKRGTTLGRITYQEAIQLLQDHYITEQIIQNYELAFNEMCQSQGESPQVFLSRLYEAADLAEIKEEKLTHSRFRAGLLPILKTFCREQSASSFEQWVRHSEGWWNAHAPQAINLVENPFVAHTKQVNYPINVSTGNSLTNEKSVRFIDERVNTLKDVNSKIYKSNNKAYANGESPTMSALTAKLEALDLHQLIPYIDSNEHTNKNIIQGPTTESFKTNKNLKTFIKNIVQEVVENDMKEDTRNFGYYESKRNNNFRRPRRNYYSKEDLYFDNDAASPSEGYYTYRRQYDQQPDLNYRNNYNNRNSYSQPPRQPNYNYNFNIQNNGYRNDYQMNRFNSQQDQYSENQTSNENNTNNQYRPNDNKNNYHNSKQYSKN